MLDRRRQARLAQEVGPERLVVAVLGRQHLERDLASEARVDRAIHHAHPAAIEDRLDAVPPDVRADRWAGLYGHADLPADLTNPIPRRAVRSTGRPPGILAITPGYSRESLLDSASPRALF